MNFFSKLHKKGTEPRCAAVILAAGSSERMGTDKVMLPLGSKPVLVRTLQVFQNTECVDEIVIVTRSDKLESTADLCHENGFTKVRKVCLGGKTRMESSLAGVSEVSHGIPLVAIHDAARPLVTAELIERVVASAAKNLAAVPAIASTDTLKTVDENGRVCGAVDRSTTVRVQTPQVFHTDLIKGALTKAVSSAAVYTDDCSAIESMGVKVHVVEGDVNNMKLTTPKDMLFAAAILRDRGEYI